MGMNDLSIALWGLAGIGLIFGLVLNYFMGKKYKEYMKAAGIKKWDSIVSDKGVYGEYLTFEELKKHGGDIHLNLYLPKNDKGEYSEIDLVYVDRRGVFVIESKNYSGIILGKSDDKTWVQFLNKKSKYRFYNPIKQNENHIKALLKNTAIPKKHIISIICFSERCDLSKLEAVKQTSIPIFNRNKINNFLKTKTKYVFTQDEVDVISEELKKYGNRDAAFKQEHIDNISNKKRRH